MPHSTVVAGRPRVRSAAPRIHSYQLRLQILEERLPPGDAFAALWWGLHDRDFLAPSLVRNSSPTILDLSNELVLEDGQAGGPADSATPPVATRKQNEG